MPESLFVIACGPRIDDFAIFSALGGIAAVGLLLSAGLYLPYRKVVRSLNDSPLAQIIVGIMVAGLALGLSGFGALFGGVFLGLVLAEAFKDAHAVVYLSLVALAGIGVWLWVYAIKTRDKTTRETASAPWQLQLQDLLVASVCFATGLAILSGSLEHPDRPEEFAPFAAYLLAVGTVGLFIGVDVCRHSAGLQRPMSRIAAFVIIFTLMPFGWFLIVPVWLVRRRHWKSAPPA
jgi:hypothetical protein